jgi:3-dehydroquinate synthase
MTRISEPSPPVVVLAGFMGTGKTDVGRALARILGVEFIDTDALVEGTAGMTVAEIFERDGEGRFRELESDVCRSLSPAGGAVVATGGGMVVDDDNRRRLSELGTLVLLETTVDEAVERLRGSGSRPLLAAVDEAEADADAELRRRVESLLEKRKPAYDRIAFRVDTTGRSPEETASEIASLFPLRCRVIHMDVDVRPLPQINGVAHPAAAAGDKPCECRIVIGRGAASALGMYMRDAGLASRAFLFMPKHLVTTFMERVKPSLDAASIPHEAVPIADGDANKNLAQVRDLLDRLAAGGAGRDSAVVSVGGGVTGDVSGFVASTYMRGIPFIQIPTTLVSQVDASIGGKVGVNHPRAKNLIGAIYQPVLVLNDPLLLEGLPRREISNGMAEVIKTAIIGSPELYEYVYAAREEPADKKLSDAEFLEYCTFEAARVKADIVEGDPYERDLRRVLNVGHTLGHALESAMEYEGIKHGEAVALGTIAAIRVAVERGRADPAFLNRTVAILEWCGLPTRTPAVDRNLLRRALKLDKKVKSGNLFFILPKAAGDVEIVGDVTEDELLGAL